MQPLPTGARTFSAPSFRLIDRKPPPVGAFLLAIVTAVGALFAVLFLVAHTEHARLNLGGSDSSHSSGGPSSAGDHPGGDDDDDDPSQIDTIVLGDPADAPVPGKHGNHVSPVHPTIVVRLPRYGDQVGKIPDTPAGHLLWSWLAAFNQASSRGLGEALPSLAPGSATAAQMALRKATGGFNLLSAKEVQPGVMVFRLRDQTPEATEVLGTLQVRPESIPAAIGSFSLRAVEVPGAAAGANPGSVGPQR